MKKVETLDEVKIFLENDLKVNVVRNATKDSVVKKFVKRIEEIESKARYKSLMPEAEKLKAKVNKIRNTEIDYYLCLENSQEYYYDKCIECIEFLGDLTMRNTLTYRFDNIKEELWHYVGLLVEDNLMLEKHDKNEKETTKND